MNGPCFKCKVKPGTVPSRDGVSKLYCSSCFSEFCTKAIREALFGSCGVPSDEPLPIGVSGSHSSLCLLYHMYVLAREGSLRGGSGRLNFFLLPFHLCEVELVCSFPLKASFGKAEFSSDGENNGLGSSEANLPRSKSCNSMEMRLIQYCNDLVNNLEAQLNSWSWLGAPLFSPRKLRIFRYSDFFSEKELEFLQSVLHHPQISLSNREELYDRLRQSTLCAAAQRITNEWRSMNTKEDESLQALNGSPQDKSLWVHHIVGDTAIRCCVEALRSLSVGGGGGVMLQRAGFRSFSHHVVTLRPMRVLLPREVVLFNRLNGIHGYFGPTLSTGFSKCSVLKVLENFVYRIVSTHRSILFNVLAVVTHLSAKELFPDTFGVLDSTKGLETMDKKCMVFSKAVLRHTFLSTNSPPQLSGVYENVSTLKGNVLRERRCLICGYPFLPHVNAARGDVAEGFACSIAICVSCRECINDVFSERIQLSADTLLEIWGKLIDAADVPQFL